MRYEVEVKFRVDNMEEFHRQLREAGAVFAETVRQEDVYFQHPGRDFASTDEALRLRKIGSLGWITYKGPKLDLVSKTRQEIEIPIAGGEASLCALRELLLALGFTVVLTVRKTRSKYALAFEGVAIEGAIDEVDGLGRFVELEAVGNDETLDAVHRSVMQLAKRWSLKHSERRSYLEMLLERQGS
jgi:adenylate cyclase class 2